MSMLYIDRKGLTVKADGQALVFYENGVRAGTVPIAPLDGVVLRGDTCIHSGVLGKLGENGVPLTVLSGRKAEPVMMLTVPHKNTARRIGQYRLATNTRQRLVAAINVVRQKVQGQAELLRERATSLGEHRHVLLTAAHQIEDVLLRLDECDSIASLRGQEGAAAARYFQAIADTVAPSLEFSGRNRRPPRDPLNALMSLTYTLLDSECSRVLYGMGLDPFLGFYHQPEYGRKSLSCDLVEALRPQADRWCLKLFADRTLRLEHFSKTDEGCLMSKEARAAFYPAYEQFANGVRSLIEQRARNLVSLADTLGQEKDDDEDGVPDWL